MSAGRTRLDPFNNQGAAASAAAAVAAAALLCRPQSVPSSMTGTALAVDMSLGSGLRTLSPLIGTALVTRHGFPGVCVAAAGVLLTAFGAASCLQGPVSVQAAKEGRAGSSADAVGVTAAAGEPVKKTQ